MTGSFDEARAIRSNELISLGSSALLKRRAWSTRHSTRIAISRILLSALLRQTYNFRLFHSLSLDTSATIHVFGSGSTADKALASVQAGDSCFLINAAGLLPVDGTVLFTETGCYLGDTLAKSYREIVTDFLARTDGIVVVKNLWQHPIVGAKRPRREREYLLEDRLLHAADYGSLAWVADELLKESDEVLQYGSSVITAVAVAARLGFSDICLHGVDFSGRYFYESSPNRYPKAANLPRTVARRHSTATSPLGIHVILPIMKSVLRERGTILRAAIEGSPADVALKRHI